MTMDMVDVRDGADSKRYYGSPDYYAEGQELHFEAEGKLADQLELTGAITLDELRSLFDKVHPRTGEKLYQRKVEDAIAAKDVTFSPPKSVVIMAQVAGDDRIFAAHDRVTSRIMGMMEPHAQVRERKGLAKNSDAMRTVGNMLWVKIRHLYPRPVKGYPDPGFHDHVLAFNIAHDPEEGKYKAAQLFGLKSQMPEWQAVYHNELAREMRGLGYKTRATKDAFELSGVPMHVIAKFSRRSDVINDPANLAKVKSPKGKAALAAYTREKKVPGLPEQSIYSKWMDSLTDSERNALADTYGKAVGSVWQDRSASHLSETLGRLLKAESAVPEERLMVATLKAGCGEVTLEGLREAMAGHVRVKVDGVAYVTTEQARQRERDVVRSARDGNIRIHRLKRGEEVEPQPGETVLKNPTFDQLHAARDQRLLVTYPYRLYTDKQGRGNPNVFLEDVAHVWTNQERPKPKLVAKVITVGRQVTDKVMKHIRHMRRLEHVRLMEQTHVGSERSVAAEKYRGLEFGRG